MAGNKKHPGRFYDLNNFVDISMRDLTRAEIATWLALYRSARERVVRLSREQIATASGCSVKAVGVALQSLVEKGLVRQTRKGSLNRGPSVYQIRGAAKP